MKKYFFTGIEDVGSVDGEPRCCTILAANFAEAVKEVDEEYANSVEEGEAVYTVEGAVEFLNEKEDGTNWMSCVCLNEGRVVYINSHAEIG